MIDEELRAEEAVEGLDGKDDPRVPRVRGLIVCVRPCSDLELTPETSSDGSDHLLVSVSCSHCVRDGGHLDRSVHRRDE